MPLFLVIFCVLSEMKAELSRHSYHSLISQQNAARGRAVSYWCSSENLSIWLRTIWKRGSWFSTVQCSAEQYGTEIDDNISHPAVLLCCPCDHLFLFDLCIYSSEWDRRVAYYSFKIGFLDILEKYTYFYCSIKVKVICKKILVLTKSD